MPSKIIRMGVIAHPDLSGGLYPYSDVGEPNPISGAQLRGALDDGIGGAFGTQIHFCGGTDNSRGMWAPGNPAGVFNRWWKSVDYGRSFSPAQTAPWSRRNACAYGQAQSGFETPRLLFIGGKGEEVSGPDWGGYLESWYLDASGWHKIADIISGPTFTSLGSFIRGFWSARDAKFYLFSGHEGDGKIWASSDLVAFAEVGAVPADYVGVGMYSVCEWRGAWYMAGRETVGKLYKSEDRGQTWILLSSDNTMFGQDWPHIVGCRDFLFYMKGASKQAGQDASANQRGCYVMLEPDEPFRRLPYEHEPTHAATVFPSADGTAVIVGMGNFQTTVWKVWDTAM